MRIDIKKIEEINRQVREMNEYASKVLKVELIKKQISEGKYIINTEIIASNMLKDKDIIELLTFKD